MDYAAIQKMIEDHDYNMDKIIEYTESLIRCPFCDSIFIEEWDEIISMRQTYILFCCNLCDKMFIEE